MKYKSIVFIKEKSLKEYSTFNLIFFSFVFITLIIYWNAFHYRVLEYFEKNTDVLFWEFWIFTLTFFMLYKPSEERLLEYKFSLLFKDLSIQNQVSYKSITPKIPINELDRFEKTEFNNQRVNSYVKINESVFNILCIKKENWIRITLMREEKNNQSIFICSKLLENYKSLDNLVSYYIKSFHLNNPTN
jgi:hypothetical protein